MHIYCTDPAFKSFKFFVVLVDLLSSDVSAMSVTIPNQSLSSDFSNTDSAGTSLRPGNVT